MPPLLVYLSGLATLIVGDLLWLGFLMRNFYATHLGHLMAPTVTWGAAALFYLTYTFAIWWFVVSPAVGKPLTHIAFQGALFGALAYAVYDLTNHATLKNWPVIVTVVDISWGTFLTMLIALAMASILKWNA